MTRPAITDHARERAVERYGFEPTRDEVAKILSDCATGIAPCFRKDERGRIHICKVRSKIMVVCLAISEPLIITVLDRSYFNSGARLKHHTKAYGLKQRVSAHKHAMLPEYKRARWKAEGREIAEDV